MELIRVYRMVGIPMVQYTRNFMEMVTVGKLSVDCLLVPTATLWMAQWTMLT